MVLLLTSLLALPGFHLPVEESQALDIGVFSAAEIDQETHLPRGWVAMTFGKMERHTRYRLVEEGGVMVIKAESDRSCSGLLRKISVDTRSHPVLRWRWKIMNIHEKGDATRKSGDDYPGRVYILFDPDPAEMGLTERIRYEAARLVYGDYPPIGCLIYIWGNRTERGTVIPNPFTDRARMIVVESGKTRLGMWIEEERNVYEDYRTAFGGEPPLVGGVAIMTDSDNTGASATAYYGDIRFEEAGRL